MAYTWDYETLDVLDCILRKIGDKKGYRAVANIPTAPIIVVDDYGESHSIGWYSMHEAVSLITRYPDLYRQCLSGVRKWYRQLASQMG